MGATLPHWGKLMNQHHTDVMTVEEVAEYLRIPKSSIYKLAQESRIPCQKVGRHWRFHRETLKEWLSNSIGARDLTNS